MKNSELNTKLATLGTKAELKAEQRKIVKLHEFDSSYFQGNNLFGDDGFQQNMFVYQPTVNTLELINDKNTEYVTGWKSKAFFKSKLLPLHGAFFPDIKYFGHKIAIKFNNILIQLRNKTITRPKLCLLCL